MQAAKLCKLLLWSRCKSKWNRNEKANPNAWPLCCACAFQNAISYYIWHMYRCDVKCTFHSALWLLLPTIRFIHSKQLQQPPEIPKNLMNNKRGDRRNYQSSRQKFLFSQRRTHTRGPQKLFSVESFRMV